MSMLTRWKPFGKTSELDVWRPATGWDPLREMGELMQGMQRMMSSWPARNDEPLLLTEWTPSVDIGENDKEFLFKAELPEVNKDDIKVSVDDGTLSISGERKVEKEEKGLKFHRIERAFGRFERTFSLPIDAESDKISSEYTNGVLTVHVPKNLAAKPAVRQVPVK